MTNNPTGFNRLTQWLKQRQLRVLSNAFAEAQDIKELEDQYYNGDKIAYSQDQSKTVYDYVRSLRDRKLIQIRTNLTQFRLNSFLLNQSATEQAEPTNPTSPQDQAVLDQLNFIESVIGKYRESPEDDLARAAAMMEEQDLKLAKGSQRKRSSPADGKSAAEIMDPVILEADADSQQRKRGLFGGSLIGRDLDPNYEQRVVQELRLQRQQNQVALRWLALIIIVPLLVGLLSRQFVFEPLLGNFSDKYPDQIQLSNEIQEEFALRLSNYKEQIEIKELLGMTPEMTTEAKQAQLSERATELWREAREEELNGLKNLLADIVALIAFVALVYFNRSRLAILRSATNRTFLSLSDPTKVFLFILLTDMFVGFHSAEGWSVILNGIGNHFGLPENEAAIGLFIATVPVILDSFIKFWIFNYLTRFSPPLRPFLSG
jgi:hypothetical protein